MEWLFHHWYFFFWLWVFGFFEGVQDFFLGCADYILSIGQRKHKRQLELIKAQAKAYEKLAQHQHNSAMIAELEAAKGSKKPGQCVHRNVSPIITRDDVLVGWLCKKVGCEKKLPADWAVLDEDL